MLSLIESELTALSSILIDELVRLDDKLIAINKSIATAKAAGVLKRAKVPELSA